MRPASPQQATSGGEDGACGLGQRIIQIHPTLRCNLRCHHCYSESGPEADTSLDSRLLVSAISDAARMGYEVVSFSGGEPLLYPELAELLQHARSLGLRTTVTTNGTLLVSPRLRQLREHLDVLAISLDGPPGVHNAIRGAPWAFDRLQAGLAEVRRLGFTFGLIHTLTRHTWEHLVWVAEFAAHEGAALLQVHPLEMTGRAEQLLRADQPPADVFGRAYLLVQALAQAYRGRMVVQLDLLLRDQMLDHPELVYAAPLTRTELGRLRPADLLGVLVVEADGTAVPISYGFSRHYAICNIRHQRLSAGWATYAGGEGYSGFRQLCGRVLEELRQPDADTLVNWHELIVARSQAPSTSGRGGGVRGASGGVI